MASNVSATALLSIPTACQQGLTIFAVIRVAESACQDLPDPELSHGEHPRIIVGVARPDVAEIDDARQQDIARLKIPVEHHRRATQ